MLDVAKIAGGIHPSTVSLVLRNSPSISEATRKRVLAAVRKVGYRRDPMLDAFNHHRMGVIPHKSEPVIACVCDLDSKEDTEQREPHRSFLRGARAAADHLHCRLELFLIGKGQLSPERLNGIVQARGITSVLVLGLGAGIEKLPFSWDEYSAVRVESLSLALPRLAIASDQRQGARLALRALAAAGYARVGLLLGPASPQANRDLILAGHLVEQSRLPAANRVPPLQLPATGDHRALAADWLARNRITAVIADSPPLQAILPGTGNTTPAFAALDVTGAPETLAGILPDHERVGAQAVEQLVSLMRANQRGPSSTEATTYVPVRWRPGTSAPGT